MHNSPRAIFRAINFWKIFTQEKIILELKFLIRKFEILKGFYW
jgi:hypothetical protein